jgi:beta-glucanase (GH16 family)
MSFEKWRGRGVTALLAGTAAALTTTVLLVVPLGAPVGPAAATFFHSFHRPPTTTTTTSPPPTTSTTTTTTTTSPPPTTTTTTTSPPPTTTTTTAAQTGSSSGCQGATPDGLSGSWNCSFDDEFNGTSLDTSLWSPELTAQNLYVAGPDCYVNTPQTISESGGYLNLSAVKVPTTPCVGNYSTQYLTGMVTTRSHFTKTYGAYEVRAKLPVSTAPGLQETFWLYPQNLTYGKWPASGEIDFGEFYSDFPTFDVPYIHYNEASSDPNVTGDCLINPAGFNTYGVDWQPGTITIYLNGVQCLVDHPDPATPLVSPEPFDQPFFLVLTQAIGFGSNAPIDGLTQFPSTTLVDYARAWS